MSSDIVKVSFNIIKEVYNSIDIDTIPHVLIRKKQELQSDFKCFQPNYVPEFYEVKKYSKFVSKKKDFVPNYYHTVTQPLQKIYVIPVDFTEENKVKKMFKGYLNKLTIKNKENIQKQIQDLIDQYIKQDNIIEIIYEILWDFIKKSPSDVFYDIINLFPVEKTNNFILQYIHQKKWYPCDNFIQKNILSSSSDMYDEYCDYVKWKKETTNIIKFICCLTPKDQLNDLMNDLVDLFKNFKNNQKTHKHILDFVLEQLYNVLSKNKNQEIIEKLKNISCDLESSTKFLMFDILEL